MRLPENIVGSKTLAWILLSSFSRESPRWGDSKAFVRESIPSVSFSPDLCWIQNSRQGALELWSHLSGYSRVTKTGFQLQGRERFVRRAKVLPLTKERISICRHSYECTQPAGSGSASAG